MTGFVFSVQSETVYDASRYELIIERAPFGQEVVIEEPTVTPERELALAQAAAQAAEKSYVFVLFLKRIKVRFERDSKTRRRSQEIQRASCWAWEKVFAG